MRFLANANFCQVPKLAKGKKKLTGELGISGAKNAVLKQIVL